LRDATAKDIFDVVYIHSPDRLARKYVYQALVIEELRKNGVEIKFLKKKTVPVALYHQPYTPQRYSRILV